MDRKWKLTKFGLAVGVASLVPATVSHLQGTNNTTLVIGILTYIAGIIGEYFAANAAINRHKSENYRAEIQDEK